VCPAPQREISATSSACSAENNEASSAEDGVFASGDLLDTRCLYTSAIECLKQKKRQCVRRGFGRGVVLTPL